MPFYPFLIDLRWRGGHGGVWIVRLERMAFLFYIMVKLVVQCWHLHVNFECNSVGANEECCVALEQV